MKQKPKTQNSNAHTHHVGMGHDSIRETTATAPNETKSLQGVIINWPSFLFLLNDACSFACVHSIYSTMAVVVLNTLHNTHIFHGINIVLLLLSSSMLRQSPSEPNIWRLAERSFFVCRFLCRTCIQFVRKTQKSLMLNLFILFSYIHAHEHRQRERFRMSLLFIFAQYISLSIYSP